MFRKISFGLLWIGFVTYAFLFAPPNTPNTLPLIKDLSLGNLQGINPLITALFYMMGLLPVAYACFLFIDGRGQKIWAWPFSVVSFGVGAFALLPYLALRNANPTFPGEKNSLIRVLDSRILGVILTLGAITLISWGCLSGDWSDFVQQWQTSRFIHVMSLDFCVLCLVLPSLLGDDFARRGMESSGLLWALSLIPLLGPLVYLCIRKPLSESNSNPETSPQPSMQA